MALVLQCVSAAAVLTFTVPGGCRSGSNARRYATSVLSRAISASRSSSESCSCSCVAGMLTRWDVAPAKQLTDAQCEVRGIVEPHRKPQDGHQPVWAITLAARATMPAHGPT